MVGKFGAAGGIGFAIGMANAAAERMSEAAAAAAAGVTVQTVRSSESPVV